MNRTFIALVHASGDRGTPNQQLPYTHDKSGNGPQEISRKHKSVEYIIIQHFNVHVSKIRSLWRVQRIMKHLSTKLPREAESTYEHRRSRARGLRYVERRDIKVDGPEERHVVDR